jgi:hypothetical protein
LESKKDHDAANTQLTLAPNKHVMVKSEGITVSEGLSKPEIQRLVEKQINAINRCYAKESEIISGLITEAEITLTVDTAGRITNVSMDKNRIKNKALETCIINLFEKLRLPASKKGGMVRVIVAFMTGNAERHLTEVYGS